MKRLFTLLMASASLFLFSCDDGEVTSGGDNNDNVISTNITANTTWEGGNTYVLGGRIVVEAGATLTIEPGTIIKGQAGSGANATALVIARGAKIMAEGTATEPIIFTSVADEIEPGQIESPNLDANLNGLWGGLIVLGNATISADADAVQIEGIPPSDQNGLYGGTDDADNSGVIKYVSIRHGGANIGEGNEINGLTLGGVGTGTQISYVEVVANQDDGIECFGGSVNITNALVWNQGDDAYDMDQAYKGTIENFIYIGGPDSDHAMELDGPEGSKTGTFTLTKGTLKGWNEDGQGGGEYIDFRSGVTANVTASYFFNFSEDSDVELDNEGVAANYINGEIVMTDLEFNVSHLSAGNVTIDGIFADKSDAGDAFTQVPLAASIATATSRSAGVGADKAAFSGWSWAAVSGELSDF